MTKLIDKIKGTIKQADNHIKMTNVDYVLKPHIKEKSAWLKRTLDGVNEDKITASEAKLLKKFLDDFAKVKDFKESKELGEAFLKKLK